MSCHFSLYNLHAQTRMTKLPVSTPCPKMTMQPLMWKKDFYYQYQEHCHLSNQSCLQYIMTAIAVHSTHDGACVWPDLTYFTLLGDTRDRSELTHWETDLHFDIQTLPSDMIVKLKLIFVILYPLTMPVYFYSQTYFPLSTYVFIFYDINMYFWKINYWSVCVDTHTWL